jgi:hypothetical protein
MQKPPSPAARMTAVWVQAAARRRLLGLLAAVLAAGLALVLAALDTGFALVSAALFAGFASAGAGGEGGQGEEGEKRFHDDFRSICLVDFQSVALKIPPSRAGRGIPGGVGFLPLGEGLAGAHFRAGVETRAQRKGRELQCNRAQCRR